jgi:hypothetical protein
MKTVSLVSVRTGRDSRSLPDFFRGITEGGGLSGLLIYTVNPLHAALTLVSDYATTPQRFWRLVRGQQNHLDLLYRVSEGIVPIREPNEGLPFRKLMVPGNLPFSFQ